MISIVKATRDDYRLLSEIAKITFIESHGHSAKSEDINFYISQKYQESIFEEELLNNENIYHLIYHNNVVAGFSNIILNSPYPGSKNQHIAKLERLYLLRNFYGLNLGLQLFEFNIIIARQNNQTGIWLYVWKENRRAINFYQKVGFTIIGSHEFKISDAHSNPNHQMFLKL